MRRERYDNSVRSMAPRTAAHAERWVAGWGPSRYSRRFNTPREIVIPYGRLQHGLYRKQDPACIYHKVRWPIRTGRSRFGEFPVVVAREHFRSLGYVVYASEPRLPNAEGYILLAYPRKRLAGVRAYRRMERIFGEKALAELNTRADDAKRRLTGNRGGGDPDLFVYRPTSPQDRFFVEVKHHEELTRKQMATFPLIQRLCPVRVARLIPRER